MEQDSKKYQSLPTNVQQAVERIDIAKKIQTIGQNRSLHMDQIGLLTKEVDAVILGTTDSEDLIERIEENLAIDTEKAIALTTDINLEVFVPLREIILKETESPLTSKEPTRESILAEIENPTPTVHPISAVDQTVAGPATSREIIPETAHTVAHDFISSKLTETVNLPSQKAAVTLKAPEKPKGYSTDPYREAIN